MRFAAEKHRDQRRKGRHQPPYVNHLIEVAELLTDVGEVTATPTLVAAILHDTVEDTETTPDEIAREFGERVGRIVAEVTDDKSLPKQERKRLQVAHAASLSRAAKLVKLGDKTSNIREIVADPPTDWSLERKREYLDWAMAVVNEMRGTNAALEARFDAVHRDGMAKLDAQE